ncbi:MAG: anti-sigma-factor antagonist [Clostridia bacterium]|nr:anti-sigma-factor antagonist [Clostridia bacterium]
MSIDFAMVNRTLVVNLEGELDHHTCVEIRQTVDREYQKKRAKNLLFDFANINFMDSSGIGMLMGRYRSVIICGGEIALYNVTPEAERILAMSGIHKLMKTYASKQEALEALA